MAFALHSEHTKGCIRISQSLQSHWQRKPVIRFPIKKKKNYYASWPWITEPMQMGLSFATTKDQYCCPSLQLWALELEIWEFAVHSWSVVKPQHHLCSKCLWYPYVSDIPILPDGITLPISSLHTADISCSRSPDSSANCIDIPQPCESVMRSQQVTERWGPQ